MRLPQRLLLLSIASLFASPALSDDSSASDNVKATTTIIASEIVDVEYIFQTSAPPNLIVTATARFNSGGYTNMTLARVIYKQPPSDGIQEYIYTAVPPSGPSTDQIVDAKASNIWKSVPSWVSGIRIRGVGDGVLEKTFGSPSAPPSGPILIEGISSKGDIGDAFTNLQKAIDKELAKSGSDFIGEWEIVNIRGKRGGIAGLREIVVSAWLRIAGR